MAVDPPPVEADLAGFGSDSSAGPLQTEFWRNLWPWDDLNAKEPPAAWQQLHKDILPVLAALTAIRSPSGPRALAADASGRLLTAGAPYFTDRVVQGAAANSAGIVVADGSIHAIGEAVYYIPATGGVPSLFPQYLGIVTRVLQNQVDAFWTLSVSPLVTVTQVAGDSILILPPPNDWLPPSPWKQPRDVPAIPLAQAGIGVQHLVGAVANKNVYVFKGMIAVTSGIATGEARLQDSAGNVRWRGSAAAVGNIPVDLGGAPIGALGTGLDIAVAVAAATCVFSIATSQA